MKVCVCRGSGYGWRIKVDKGYQLKVLKINIKKKSKHAEESKQWFERCVVEGM